MPIMMRLGALGLLVLALSFGFVAGMAAAPRTPHARAHAAAAPGETLVLAPALPARLAPPGGTDPRAAQAAAARAAFDPLAPLLDPAELPHNYAHFSEGARALGGFRPALLIDGNSVEYDDQEGFAQTHWTVGASEHFTVTLRETVALNVVRFLLWSRDNRYYRYKLEASAEAEPQNWTVLADKTGEDTECRGWQVIGFPSQSVRHVRLTGTFNSANDYFHVVELQVFKVSGQPEAEEGELEF